MHNPPYDYRGEDPAPFSQAEYEPASLASTDAAQGQQWRAQVGRFLVPPDLHRTYDMDRAVDVTRIAKQLSALESEMARLREYKALADWFREQLEVELSWGDPRTSRWVKLERLADRENLFLDRYDALKRKEEHDD